MINIWKGANVYNMYNTFTEFSLCSFSPHCRIWDISSQTKRRGEFCRRAGGTLRIPSCAHTNWSLSSSRCGVCRLAWSSSFTRWEVIHWIDIRSFMLSGLWSLHLSSFMSSGPLLVLVDKKCIRTVLSYRWFGMCCCWDIDRHLLGWMSGLVGLPAFFCLHTAVSLQSLGHFVGISHQTTQLSPYPHDDSQVSTEELQLFFLSF